MNIQTDIIVGNQCNVTKIEEYYTAHPDADLVIFNFKVKRGNEPLHDANKKNKKRDYER